MSVVSSQNSTPSIAGGGISRAAQEPSVEEQSDRETRMAPTSMRHASMPPTGTAKADDKAATEVKARAIATLQRLFFEEMAKGTNDANGAAVAALRRLSEVPDVSCSSTVVAAAASSSPSIGPNGGFPVSSAASGSAGGAWESPVVPPALPPSQSMV